MVLVGVEEQFRRLHLVEIADAALAEKGERLNQLFGIEAESDLRHCRREVYLGNRARHSQCPPTAPPPSAALPAPRPPPARSAVMSAQSVFVAASREDVRSTYAVPS